MDYVYIEDLEVKACHGVKDFEKKNPQPFLFCVKLYADIFRASKNDELTETINYSTVSKQLTAFCVNNCFDLIETLADRSATLLLETYPLLKKVEVTVKKPEAPVKLPFKCMSVTVERGRHTVYLSLGSNLGDKKAYLDFAVNALNSDGKVKALAVSDYIETEPCGGVATETFLNAAVKIETFLQPTELLDYLHSVEERAGRERLVRWGNRTLDIDILVFDDLVLCSEILAVPHPEMYSRAFVLEPLAQIAPDLTDPVSHRKFKEFLNK